MEFRILGPLEVIGSDGSLLRVGGGRERALLALLLASPNMVVSADRLLSELWESHSSEASMHALQVHMSRLRKALGTSASNPAIVTRSGGYLLQVDPQSIDAARFDMLVARARELVSQAKPEIAAAVFREALALWRGPALHEVADGAYAGPEAARLEEARLGAIEDRVEADMFCGLHADVVSELDHLTRAHPFRERLWSLRLLALYRAGRQVDALRTYQDLRRLLREDLGLEPSAVLVALDLAIARRDPLLDVPWRAAAALAGVTARPSETQDPPATHFASSGGVKIGYQIIGEGPIDVVLVPGFVSNVDLYWDNPGWRQIFERLSGLCRLIVWDKRGTGVSDPVQRVATLDERADDLAAVMDAAKSEQATLFGISEGGALSLLFAATRPHRVRSLVLYGATPRITASHDWLWGWSEAQTQRVLEAVVEQWGAGALLGLFAPTELHSDVGRRGWARSQRAGASPAMGLALMEAMIATDCREVLSAVAVPTLVLHRTGDAVAHLNAGRYIAESVAGSRFVELDGENHLITAGHLHPILVEIENFLTARSERSVQDRALTTVLCIDPVPRDLSKLPIRHSSDSFSELVSLELARFGGEEITFSGTCLFTTFVAPSRAIECVKAIQQAATLAGVALRSGIHTGERDRRSIDVNQFAFRIAAALSLSASPGQVLTTGTVKDLVAGSDFLFHSLGARQLTGIPGTWPVFTITA